MAVAITVILLVPLIRNFTANLDNGATADSTIEATLIAESMIETLGARLPMSPDESVADEGRFSVAASVQPFVGENGSSAGRYVIPYELAVSVSWREGRRRRAVTLHTVRLAASAQQ